MLDSDVIQNRRYDAGERSGEQGLHLRSVIPAPKLTRQLDVQELSSSIQTLSRAIESRDAYTHGHSQRVARLAFELAEILGLSQDACCEIYLAGILHDVGKIGIPDDVLLKAGSLSDDEMKIIRRHPEVGYKIVEPIASLHFALPGILYHHERWDGQGYPHGLAGEELPVMARIMAVADAFDAMTSCRPYRTALPLEKAQAIIKSGRGTQWDAEVAKCLLIWIDNPGSTERAAVKPPRGSIPQDSLVETIHQAMITLGQ